MSLVTQWCGHSSIQTDQAALGQRPPLIIAHTLVGDGASVITSTFQTCSPVDAHPDSRVEIRPQVDRGERRALRAHCGGTERWFVGKRASHREDDTARSVASDRRIRNDSTGECPVRDAQRLASRYDTAGVPTLSRDVIFRNTAIVDGGAVRVPTDALTRVG
jgi:hypothetical protein